MKRVEIIYFAVLREQRGLTQETIETNAETPKILYDSLCAVHGFTVAPELIKVAIDGSIRSMEEPLPCQCSLVFIPPVAGG